MNRVVKIFKTLRNNWKKSVFGGVLLYYGGSWARDRYKLEVLMRCYCEEARKLGHAAAPVDAKLPKVTVILNPTAGKSKCRKNFDKWCAPLLYTAGLQVSIIKSESEGHARTLAESLQHTDAVVVAGGDGTLCETVTGLLRRAENPHVTELPPVGVLPLGKKNHSFEFLLPKVEGDDASIPDHPAVDMARATMNVIRGVCTSYNVLKVQNEASERPVYSMREIQFGSLRDAYEREPKYWYWGSLKSYVTYVAAAFRGRIDSRDVEMEYRLPCPGCTICEAPEAPKEAPTASSSSSQGFLSRIFHGLTVQRPKVQVGTSPKELITNPECDQWKNYKTTTTELRVTNVPQSPRCDVNIGPAELDRKQFVSEGWKQVKQEASQLFETLQAQEVRLTIPEDKDGEQLWMSIDGDEYESRPMSVRLMKNKIKLFTSAQP